MMYREFQDSREGFDAQTEAEHNAYLDALRTSRILLGGWDDDDYEDDGQPDEYTEWQDYMGGDDSDQGYYDEY